MTLQPQMLALLFTVILLAVTTYFLLGSIPLLTLKHDNPMDSRFIRSFYITYFRLALIALALLSLDGDTDLFPSYVFTALIAALAAAGSWQRGAIWPAALAGWRREQLEPVLRPLLPSN